MFYESGGKYGFGYIEQGSVIVNLKTKRRPVRNNVPHPAPMDYKTGRFALGEIGDQDVYVFFRASHVFGKPFETNDYRVCRPHDNGFTPVMEHRSAYRHYDEKGRLHSFYSPAEYYPERPKSKHFSCSDGIGGDWYLHGVYVPYFKIREIILKHELSEDWRTWTDAEKCLMRLAL